MRSCYLKGNNAAGIIWRRDETDSNNDSMHKFICVIDLCHKQKKHLDTFGFREHYLLTLENYRIK